MEAKLKQFAEIMDADEVLLFEKTTFLVIAETQRYFQALHDIPAFHTHWSLIEFLGQSTMMSTVSKKFRT